MEDKKIIILDLTGCKYLGELHERIRVAFDFPEWYGANWSAFDDLLLTECDADELIIYGEKTMPKELTLHIERMHEILDRKVAECEKYSKIYADIHPFIYRIAD